MSPQAGFLLQDQIVPRLISAIPKTVSFIAPEDPEELVQDSIAMAAKMIHNTEQAGKKIVQFPSKRKGEVSAGNIGYYVIEHIKSGRRSTGSSVVDVLGSATQLNGRSRLESMEEVVAVSEENGGEIYYLHDVLSDGQEDPSTKAARKLDWQEFVRDLPKRERLVVEFLVEGASGSAIARKLKTTDSRIQTIKRHLARALIEFMGPEILQEIQRKPQWKDSINASRERLACKHERNQ